MTNDIASAMVYPRVLAEVMTKSVLKDGWPLDIAMAVISNLDQMLGDMEEKHATLQWARDLGLDPKKWGYS